MIRLRKDLRVGHVTLMEAYLPVIALRSKAEDGHTVWTLINMVEVQSVWLPCASKVYALFFTTEDVRIDAQGGGL
jgi:hypothetical protein